MNYFHLIRKRLITLGVMPKHARQIALDFDQQVKSQGIVNALSHLKNMGDQVISFVSHSGYSAPWVSKTRDGYPKRWLVLKPYPEAIQLRVAKMARAIVLTSPTPKMVSKLRDAATSPYLGEENGISEVSRLVSLGLTSWNLPKPNFDIRYKSVFSSARTYTNRSVPIGTSVGLDFDSLLGTFRSWKDIIVTLPDWEQVFYPVHPSWIGRNASSRPNHTHVGELGGVMENGGKLRIFAAPNVVINNLLEPLQVWLDKHRNAIHMDVFRRQEDGALWAQSKLQAGKSIQSIDLSSATCRFPMETQMWLLGLLNAPIEFIKLYTLVARGSWKVQPHMVEHFGEDLQWSVGQPLGTNPSMSTFALCHSLMLIGLCVQLDLDPSDSFRILGDDVVTSSSDLANAYRLVIKNAGIEISEHKSYDSSSYAEFAGYSITTSSLVRPGRWKLPTVLNTQGLVKDLGPNVISELHTDHQAVEYLLAFRSGEFSPSSNWNLWMKANSLICPQDPFKVSLKRDREVLWYDGITKFLMKELANVYFVEERPKDFLEEIGDCEPTRKVRDLLFPTYYLMPSSVGELVLLLEAYSYELYDHINVVQFLDKVKESYEDFLWALPKTDGRKSRDLRLEVEEQLLKQLAAL